MSHITHVYVEPDVVLLANVGDLRDGVEGAVDGGAGGGVDEEGQVPLALVEHHQLLQLLRYHPTPEKSSVYQSSKKSAQGGMGTKRSKLMPVRPSYFVAHFCV